MQTRPGLGSSPLRNIAITVRGIVQIKVVHLPKSFDTINFFLLSCFDGECKMAEHFTPFTRRK